MLKILKYSFYDLTRGRWSYVYFLFYLLLAFALLFLRNDLAGAIITMLNIIIIIVPLIGTIFGVTYYYNSKEFIELLLAQPIKRSYIFLGQYLGVAISLSASLLFGLGIPFLAYGLLASTAIWNFAILLIVGVFLTFIFTAISFSIALLNENRIKGFGFAVLVWLFLAVVYDGLFLIALVYFQDYPLDKFALLATMANPIDLSRILILLQLDISALLSYTGAVFKSFFGTGIGLVIALSMLLIWVLVPVMLMIRKAKRKDF